MSDLPSQLERAFQERRKQAFEQWSRTASHDEYMDYLRSGNEAFAQRQLQRSAGPSYAEGERMPSTPEQRQSTDTYLMERSARIQAGEPAREDALRDALHWKERGYYAPDNNPSMPAPTIGELAPRPENQFQSEVQGGAPISDARSSMTPQEEQAAMQAYVRQRLLAGQGQLNLAPGQQPIEDPNAMLQRPPVGARVGPPEAYDPRMNFPNNAALDTATGGGLTGAREPTVAPPGVDPGQGMLALPGVGVAGGYSQGKPGQVTEKFNPRVMYRKTVPF